LNIQILQGIVATDLRCGDRSHSVIIHSCIVVPVNVRVEDLLKSDHILPNCHKK